MRELNDPLVKRRAIAYKKLLDGSMISGHCICLFDAREHRIRSFVHDFTHSLERHPLNCWVNHTKQRTDGAITASIAFTCDCPPLAVFFVDKTVRFCYHMPSERGIRI